jgi:hypothetical protein
MASPVVAADVGSAARPKFFAEATIQTIGPDVEGDDTGTRGAMSALAHFAWVVGVATGVAVFTPSWQH